jgi:hypothetical protein
LTNGRSPIEANLFHATHDPLYPISSRECCLAQILPQEPTFLVERLVPINDRSWFVPCNHLSRSFLRIWRNKAVVRLNIDWPLLQFVARGALGQKR